MTNLPSTFQPSSGLSTRRQDLALARDLGNLERSSHLGLARIEQSAHLDSARVQAVGYVGAQGLQAVTVLSQIEGQLSLSCPMASGRLAAIADITAASIAHVVADSARRIIR